MIKREMHDNCDGNGPYVVEIEVPDLTEDEIADRKAALEARLAARQKRLENKSN